MKLCLTPALTRRSMVLSGIAAGVILQQPRAFAAVDGQKLERVASWSYQLQGDVSGLTRVNSDIAVVDWDHIKSRWTVDALRQTPSGARRSILAYLSIGEAESWRPYWRDCCATVSKPAWLTSVTQGWADNFAVRYWDPAWQQIVRGQLDDIIAAGFDGIYLDRADSYEAFAGEHTTARADMIAFILALSKAAKTRAPGFAVVMQNAEELLSDRELLAALDGVAKEDLLHGNGHRPDRNAPDAIRQSILHLRRARAAGKPVVVVEYLPPGELAEGVKAEIAALGFVPLVTERSLSISDGDQAGSDAHVDRTAEIAD